METYLLEAVVDLAPDGIILVDPSGRIVLANRQTERLFGYAPEELIGRTVEYLVPERFRGGHIAHQASFHSRPTTRPMGSGLQLFARCKDGTELPVEISLSPVPTENGTYVTAIVRDISDRRALEEAQRRSEERYRLLAEQARDIIYRIRLVPAPPRIEYMSPSARSLTGYLPEDHYADPDLFLEIVEPEYRPLMSQLMSDPESLPNPFLVQIRKRDGDLAWHEQQFTVVRDVSGEPVAIEGIARDTTLRIRAEQDRQRLAAEAELQLDRERIARDLHDGVMQTIFAVGLNLLETKNMVGDANPSAVLSIDQSIQELRQVIDDIRRYVMALPLERLGDDLPVLLNGLVSNVREGTSLEVTLNFPERMPPLSEQQTLAVYHVAREALANVQKHARASRVELQLDVNDEGLVFQVQDDGTGFDVEARPGQEHMGLRNMRSRAEALDGTLDVASSDTTGTRVRFWLPLVPDEETSAALS